MYHSNKTVHGNITSTDVQLEYHQQNNTTQHVHSKPINKDDECTWYHQHKWWSHYNLTQLNHSIDPFSHISMAYNYTKPIISTNTITDYSESLHSQCKYQGKIFNIGIQKTGTTSIKTALKQLGYKCPLIHNTRYGIGDSCTYHMLKQQYINKISALKNKVLNLEVFAVDDITWAFAKTVL